MTTAKGIICIYITMHQLVRSGKNIFANYVQSVKYLQFLQNYYNNFVITVRLKVESVCRVDRSFYDFCYDETRYAYFMTKIAICGNICTQMYRDCVILSKFAGCCLYKQVHLFQLRWYASVFEFVGFVLENQYNHTNLAQSKISFSIFYSKILFSFLFQHIPV